MDPEGSSPHTQASATCPYPEPAQSRPHTLIPTPLTATQKLLCTPPTATLKLLCTPPIATQKLLCTPPTATLKLLYTPPTATQVTVHTTYCNTNRSVYCSQRVFIRVGRVSAFKVVKSSVAIRLVLSSKPTPLLRGEIDWPIADGR